MRNPLQTLPERSLVLLFLATVTVLRLVYASQLGMFYDECCYWQWSRHLDYGYYDQGPGIAYVIRLGTLLWGDTALGVRFVNILLAAGSSWWMYLTANRWFPEQKVGWWTVLLLSIAPLYGTGSMIATYDGPQVFCWALGMWLFTQLLHSDHSSHSDSSSHSGSSKKQILLWYAIGIVVGLGVLCKLTMLLFAPGVLLFLLLSPKHRRYLSTPHPYLAFALALLCASPLWLWNFHHENMGFQHALTLGSRSRGKAFGHWLADFLGGQIGVIGPWLFIAELVATFQLLPKPSLNNDTNNSNKRFVLAFILPTLALCLWTALRSKMEANWPAPMHLAGMMAVAIGFSAAWEAKKRLGIIICVILSLCIQGVILFPELPGRFIKPLDGPKVGVKLCEPYDWSGMTKLTEQAREALEKEGKPVLLIGLNYKVNSVMAFYLKDHPETQGLYLGSRLDQYYIWTDVEAMKGKNALLCFDQENNDAPKEARQYFASADFYGKVNTYRLGFQGPVKTWVVYLCRDFKGYNPREHFNGY